MYAPSQGLNLDIEAISGICGSVSIACWVVVFSPQIIENFRRSSAEGLSIVFLVIWLAGDVFNILGALLQGVLPTMIILALYYTIADIVLIGQFFYYQGFTLKDKVSTPDTNGHVEANGERRPLLAPNGNTHAHPQITISDADGRRSSSPFLERILSVDGTHLSPATPWIPESDIDNESSQQPARRSPVVAAVLNLFAIVMVCLAGVLGWWLSNAAHGTVDNGPAPELQDTLQFNILGQVFGYICAALYLGSRIPQLLLNYRRKSTEGISMLFFLFACVGNLTYVLSIFAYEPVCRHPKACQPGEAKGIYARYIAVNLSWIIGSFGTLLLDAGVFIQYFLYRQVEGAEQETRGRSTEIDR